MKRKMKRKRKKKRMKKKKKTKTKKMKIRKLRMKREMILAESISRRKVEKTMMVVERKKRTEIH